MNPSVSGIRYQWPDVMKFIGMLMICSYHCKNSFPGGMFIFDTTLPLFLFCSGFFAGHHADLTPWAYLKLQFRRLMLPYFFFSAVYLPVLVLMDQNGSFHIGFYLLKVLAGMRGHLNAAALWFLPMIFLTSILFFLLNRLALHLTSSRTLRMSGLLGIAVILWQAALWSWPLYHYESLPWGFNFSLQYFPAYVLGYWMFPWLCRFRFQSLSRLGKMSFIPAAVAAILLALFCLTGYQSDLLKYLPDVPSLNLTAHDLLGMCCVFPLIMLSFCLNKPGWISSMGAATLLLCGTEYLSEILITQMQTLLNFHLIVDGTLSALLNGLLRMFIAYLIFVPFFRKYFPIPCNVPDTVR